ncbi:hypothetical protein F5Y10DRAFT_236245 [Nemania abortiva]|nr:hypothetical protein F5Y10DRAFT_236245 [Nemania abortiva]
MADRPDDVDVTIGLLSRATQDADPQPETREQADFQRLDDLSVCTTSGDTLVIVKFPRGDAINCHGRRWETKEFLMESQQLLRTGSSVFAAMLSPEGQVQTKRRLGRDGETHVQTQYVLNLTPPAEGDELASQVAQMSLSNGMRNWWQSCFVLNISKYLASGHDDVCPQHIEAVLSNFNIERQQRRSNDPPGAIGCLESPESRKIPDYCPIRHRAAILRVLVAISTGELVLNSAPRAATVTVVAKALDCVSVVADSVLTWLIAEPNQNFIDINTEDALTIAWILKIPVVTRAAFRILVIERAMEIVDKTRSKNSRGQPSSIFGRPRGSLSEEPETPIQHAAQRLVQRAEDVLAQLESDNVITHLGISQWPSDDQYLSHKLRDYVHHLVDVAEKQTMEFQFVGQYDQDRYRYISRNDLVPTEQIYQGLSPLQRVLTRYFWRSLFILASSDRILDSRFGLPRSSVIQGFHSELISAIGNLESKWAPSVLEINIPQTGPLALGLSDEEFNFLPLWAGGLDDGTGGVFQSEIPDAERGFPIGPGPAFCTGETIPSDDDDESSTLKGSEAPTIATGVCTDTMTNGFSVNATPSQTTGLDHDDMELAATTTKLSITRAQSSTAPPVAQGDLYDHPDIDMTATAQDNLDWMDDFSDDEDDLFPGDTDDMDMS